MHIMLNFWQPKVVTHRPSLVFSLFWHHKMLHGWRIHKITTIVNYLQYGWWLFMGNFNTISVLYIMAVSFISGRKGDIQRKVEVIVDTKTNVSPGPLPSLTYKWWNIPGQIGDNSFKNRPHRPWCHCLHYVSLNLPTTMMIHVNHNPVGFSNIEILST